MAILAICDWDRAVRGSLCGGGEKGTCTPPSPHTNSKFGAGLSAESGQLMLGFFFFLLSLSISSLSLLVCITRW